MEEQYEQGNEDVPEVSWLGTKEDLDVYFGNDEE